MLELLILLTTANCPDVLVPACTSAFSGARADRCLLADTERRENILFFAVFLVLGLWFLMPLVLACKS